MPAPKLSPETKLRKHTWYSSPDQLRRLQELSRRTGMTAPALVRHAVEALLETDRLLR